MNISQPFILRPVATTLLMIAIMAVLAVLNSGQFLAPLYIAPLGGVAAISLVAWLMTFSAKR